jgi:amidase
MERSKFIGTLIGAPLFAGLMPKDLSSDLQSSGLRRLKADKYFTVWKPDMKEAYKVALNEVVIIETSHGMPGLVTREGVFREAAPDSVINPQTGPVYVEGIEAGDSLAVDILDIQPGEWAYCSGKIFELKDGYAFFSDKLRLPLEPMLGCIGVAPAEGIVDTRAPGETGGNIDCREIRAGSTVIFKARVKGAMVGMGDVHALQGDGEITGQGLETDAVSIIRFRKLNETLSDRPVIMRQEFIATVGADKDLEDAAWQATEDMIKLVQTKTGRSKQDARLLVGLTGKLRINQIVDPTKGARMEIPSWVFGV